MQMQASTHINMMHGGSVVMALLTALKFDIGIITSVEAGVKLIADSDTFGFPPSFLISAGL